MVGVPGRSKACNTCKKRRIACGLQKPQCGQCIKSKLICGGYQRERIFIVNIGSEQNHYEAKKPASETTNSDSSSDSDRSELTLARRPRSKPQQITSGNSRGQTPEWLPEVSFQAVFRQQLFSSFLDRHVPQEYSGSLDDRTWLSLLPERPAPTKALEKSALAFCTARLGRDNNDPVLLREGLRLYTQGLMELRRALMDPKLMYLDDTLAACMTLAMFEVAECPGGDRIGYVNHHSGCTRLVQLRGPEAHRTGLSHQLFLTFRAQGVMQALAGHSPTFLADAEWNTIPWGPSGKDSFNKLLDFLALAPAIFKKADKLKILESREKAILKRDILRECWELDAELDEYYETFEKETTGPLYWPKFSPEEGEATALSPLPLEFHFPHLKVALTLMMYWAIRTILWSGMSNLYKVLIDPDAFDLLQEYDEFGLTDDAEVPPLEHRADYIEMGRNVFQSLEYCLQDKMMYMGPTAAMAPMNMVSETLKDHPDFQTEMVYNRQVVQRIHDRGMRIATLFG